MQAIGIVGMIKNPEGCEVIDEQQQRNDYQRPPFIEPISQCSDKGYEQAKKNDDTGRRRNPKNLPIDQVAQNQ